MICIDPKFADCVDCKHFRKFLPRKICSDCGVGEFFELMIDDEPPSEDELMRIYARMEKDDN